VLAGATGEQLQAHFQNPWAIGIVSVIFVLLALSMFGFYELQMPSFLQSRLTEGSQRVHGGSLRGTFVLGLISALIVGACVSPLLISALGVAISSRDPLLGGLIMFAMALGMGVILIAVGIGLGAALPRAGAWMDRVKQVFGVLLLAVAIYLLGLLPAVPVLWLWAALFIVTGVYLGATQSLPAGANGWRYLWKGLGTVLLIWGVAALIGGFSGGRDILKPLPEWHGSATAGNAAGSPGEVHFERMTSLAQIEQALAQARAQSRPALLDFYATWCTDCVRMEKGVFPDARVQARLRDFALVQADVTENDAEARAIKERFGIFGPPALLVYGADGSELRELRFYGYKTVDEFLAHLAGVESK
jgi:thiol:disulfide interchange protein DsbD